MWRRGSPSAMIFSGPSGVRSYRYLTDPFTDLLFNALLGFTFLFLVAIMLVNPVNKTGVVDPKAEFIITATWPEDRADDVDLWVEDPHGEIVSYLQRDAGWMHLDRDDRGEINDTVEIDGRTVVYPINQEIVTLRGTITGQYVVNVYYYQSVSGEPVPVTVKVERVNPEFKLAFVDQVVLEAQNIEKTVVRFTVTSGREIKDIRRTPKVLTPYLL